MFPKLLLFLSTCGAYALSSQKLNPRIFDGQPAERGQFPWQVGLYFEKNTGLTFCGGALIGELWILTAAHCVKGIRVLLGTTKSTGDDPEQMELHTNEYLYFEEFDPWGFVGDVGLVKLREAVVFNEYVQPIALASEELPPGTPVTVSGWGATSDGGTRTADLNFSNLFISSESCSGTNQEGVICVVPDPNSDSQNICGGDSGGALVLNASTNPVHVGIVSFYHTCNRNQSAGFTSTAYRREWIREKTGI